MAEFVGKQLELKISDSASPGRDERTNSSVVSVETSSEKFFLGSSLRSLSFRRGGSSANSVSNSVATDDFLSACGELDQMPQEANFRPRETIFESASFESDEKMVKSTIKKPEAPAAPAPTSSGMTVDPASVVYSTAKEVWGWGKDRIPLFPGIAEAIASKAVGVVGTDLGEIDGNIKPTLAYLDDSILNPAITKVATIVLGAVGKTEDVIKPIIIAVIEPIHKLIKNTPENTKESTAPEFTTGATTRVS